jgi:hypothetical protein
MPGLAGLTRLAGLAAITPDNTPHGYNLTFAVPLGVFAVVAVTLCLLLGRPHRRIPARRGALPGGRHAPTDAGAARAASVAGGLSVAPGGGHAESHLEPAGPVYGAGTDEEAAGAGPDPAGPADEAGPAGDGTAPAADEAGGPEDGQ